MHKANYFSSKFKSLPKVSFKNREAIIAMTAQPIPMYADAFTAFPCAGPANILYSAAIGINVERRILGTLAVAVARRFVPNVSAVAVTIKAQYPTKNPSNGQNTYKYSHEELGGLRKK